MIFEFLGEINMISISNENGPVRLCENYCVTNSQAAEVYEQTK